MKILVRLPNWLGDMVMSVGFIQALHEVYPGASVSVIVKNGLEELLDYFPPLNNRYLFSKQEFGGLRGAWKFGRFIAGHEKFDCYFSLPESFSAAVTGLATGTGKRIGYPKEGRSLLLTHAPAKDPSLHRVEQYIALLQSFAKVRVERQTIVLRGIEKAGGENVLVNINSEAVSRRLPLEKAVSLLSQLRAATDSKLIMIGGKADKAFVEEVVGRLPVKTGIEIKTGATTLPGLITEMSGSAVLLTTDSGPAHLANACGLPTVVLFGAGNEKNTAPYNKHNSLVVRLGELPCEPCVKNVCILYGIPKCLQLLNEQKIVNAVLNFAGTAR